MWVKNFLGKIFILELDDGICIVEIDVICMYFEVL